MAAGMCIIVCYNSIRFVVRDYEYDPQVIDIEKKEKDKLERDMKRQFVSFIHLCYLISRHIPMHVLMTALCFTIDPFFRDH